MTHTLDQTVVANMLWFMEERQRIYKLKSTGHAKPWTAHPVLQNYFFCNVLREQDKTTAWFRKNVRNPLSEDPSVLMATFIFRRFNFIPTGEVLKLDNLFTYWDAELAYDLLAGREKIFTGAFMISSPNGRDKLREVCRMISEQWVRRDELITKVEEATTLEAAWKIMQFEHHKGLMPYEVVTDLRWTYLLRDATDLMTWAYFGPGGQRGVMRVLGHSIERTLRPSGALRSPSTLLAGAEGQRLCNEVGAQLLAIVQDHFKDNELFRSRETGRLHMWEMRDVEHCLCETDKLLRMCEGSGQSKRRYDGL